jgi:hypothetical protein
MKKSMYCSILFVVAAFLFLINTGCSSETNVPKETSEKTTVMPSGTTGESTPSISTPGVSALGVGTLGESTPGQMKTMSESGDDASITAQVKATLLENPLSSGLDTKVETKDGVVTLSGRVKNTADKEAVANLVKDLHGVKSVVNNMIIE